MADFHVGQMVVCVNNSPSEFWSGTNLERNRIYEIKGFVESILGNLGVNVLGVDPSPCIGFRLSRFRPVRDTSIEIFRQIVADLPKPELVDMSTDTTRAIAMGKALFP